MKSATNDFIAFHLGLGSEQDYTRIFINCRVSLFDAEVAGVANDESVYVEISLFCDGCDAIVRVEADTYPVAQERLLAIAADQGWYVAERAKGANGSSAPRTFAARLTKDLCPDCYARRMSG